MTQLSATLNNVTYHFSLIQGFHYILIFSHPYWPVLFIPPSPPPLPAFVASNSCCTAYKTKLATYQKPVPGELI